MCGGSYEHISLFDERHEKIDLESLLLSYQKEEGRAWQRPSFFWYDTKFLEFESIDFKDHIL